MPTHLITYAKDKASGAYRNIKDVESGLACNCVCSNCGGVLEACKGKIRQHHFRHYSAAECNGAWESQLHLLSKAIIVQNKAVMLPEYRGKFCAYQSMKQCFEEVIQEASLDGRRPDCLCKYIDEQGTLHEIWVEICYKHPVDQEKAKHIKDNGITCLEIDVRHLFENSMIVDEATLTNFLLNSTANRTWINYPKGDDWLLQEADKVRQKNIIDFLIETSEDPKKEGNFCILTNVLFRTEYRLHYEDYNKLYIFVQKHSSDYQSLDSSIKRRYVGAVQLLLCNLTQLGDITSSTYSKEQLLCFFSLKRKDIESNLIAYVHKVIHEGKKHLPSFMQYPFRSSPSDYILVPGKGWRKKKRF